jgi:hypothetical protein
MGEFSTAAMEKSFGRFKRAAAKGHIKNLDFERGEGRGDEEECLERGLCQDGGAIGVVLCRKAFKR